jgi:lipopolysaccharide heptosyltransferase I
MPDVLFIKTSSLGDVIHHMPALTEAKRHRPEVRFAWVVEEQYAPLVALHPLVGDVIPVASRRWRRALYTSATSKDIADFIKRIRASRYDEIIDTQGLFRSALLARLARGRRHGYDAGSIREPAAAWFYDVRHGVDKQLHAIARNRALTALALGYRPQGAIDFGLDRASLTRAAAQPYALLLHATARPEKRWEEHSWIAVGRALAARGFDVLLSWGTEEERARGIRIAAEISQARVADRQSLDQTARLIAGASLVVGVDTGLLHLAAALAVPLVAIFTASEPGLTGPMGQGPIAIVGGYGAEPTDGEVIAAAGRLQNK